MTAGRVGRTGRVPLVPDPQSGLDPAPDHRRPSGGRGEAPGYIDEDHYERRLRIRRLELGIHFEDEAHPRDLKGRFKGKAIKLVGWHGKTKDEKLKPQADRPLFMGPEWLAASYAEGVTDATVQKVEHDAKNALVLDTPDKFREFYLRSGAGDGQIRLHHHDPKVDTAWRRMTRLAQENGFDAIDIPESAFAGEDGYEWVSGTVGEPQAVILKPTEAKIGKPKKPKDYYPYWEPPA